MTTTSETAQPDWGALGAALAFQIGAFVLANMVALPFIANGELRPGLVPLLAVLAAGWPMLGGAAVFSAKRKGLPWRTFVGADRVRPVDIAAAVVGVILQFAIGFAYLLAGFDDEKVSGPARSIADRAGGVGVGFVVLSVFIVVGAPLFEELFYRGVVLNAFAGVSGNAVPTLAGSLRARMAVPIALSALWFGLIHFQLLQLPALIAVGICCAVARVYTGRLATSFFLHAGFNLTTMITLALQIARK